MGEGRLSVKAGRKGARASSCFDRKPNAFCTHIFQITAPTSEVPNTVMDKHTDIFSHDKRSYLFAFEQQNCSPRQT